MAFVAAAQRAALSGVSWPTQGFDPQGRATLSGLVTPESATPDLTNAERLAGVQGFSWPTSVNTKFGRGIVSGVFVPDNSSPDTIIEVFQTEWNLIPLFSLAETANDGAVNAEMGQFIASLGANALAEETLDILAARYVVQTVRFNDIAGVYGEITDIIHRRVRT